MAAAAVTNFCFGSCCLAAGERKRGRGDAGREGVNFYASH